MEVLGGGVGLACLSHGAARSPKHKRTFAGQFLDVIGDGGSSRPEVDWRAMTHRSHDLADRCMILYCHNKRRFYKCLLTGQLHFTALATNFKESKAVLSFFPQTIKFSVHFRYAY